MGHAQELIPLCLLGLEPTPKLTSTVRMNVGYRVTGVCGVCRSTEVFEVEAEGRAGTFRAWACEDHYNELADEVERLAELEPAGTGYSHLPDGLPLFADLLK